MENKHKITKLEKHQGMPRYEYRGCLIEKHREWNSTTCRGYSSYRWSFRNPLDRTHRTDSAMTRKECIESIDNYFDKR